MTVSLTVAVPTVSRPVLRNVLLDLAAELRDVDEVLVVGDGPQPSAAAIVDEVAPTSKAAIRYFETAPTKTWGNAQRRAAFQRARGTHIMSFDDDDRVVIGAIEKVCTALKREPDRPHLFRLFYREGTIWKRPAVVCGNVSTQMIAFPNRRDRLGYWADTYQGDFEFIRSTAALYAAGEASIVWNEPVIAVHGHNGALAPHAPDCIRNHERGNHASERHAVSP